MDFKSEKISKFFDFPETNSGITKAYCRDHPGPIPVYGSSKEENSRLGSIADNLPNVKYYENCLSWNRNGSVGYVFIREHRFTTNEDHRALVLKDRFKDQLDLRYLKYEIERVLHEEGFSFMRKCGIAKIKNVSINIPISKDEFDVEAQIKLFNNFEKIRKIRNELTRKISTLPNIDLRLDDKHKFKNESVSKLFDLFKGNQVYTKAYIRKHPGPYPVYSSQTTDDGIIGSINTYDYDGEYLTWTTDGALAGTVFYRTGKFSMTTHCGALKLKQVYQGKVILKYVKYVLGSALKEGAVSYGNKRVTVKQTKSTLITLPLDSCDDFDPIVQNRIVEITEKISAIKNKLSNSIEDLLNVYPEQ